MPHYNVAFALLKITFGSYKDNVKSSNNPRYKANCPNSEPTIIKTLSL